MTYAEYTAACPEVRAAFDAARAAKKLAYLLENSESIKEIEALAVAAELLNAKRDAAFKATGNRDLYDLPVPSASSNGQKYDDAVMADYKRRQAIVNALLS